MSAQSPPDAEAVMEHLEEVLASSEFSASERRRRLLSYLVEESLAGRGGELKAYTVGASVLGRGDDFDPQTDPIVRVELHRLRASLDRFYRSRPAAPIVISIPRGGLAAAFSTALSPTADASLGVCLSACTSSADADLAAGLAHRLLAAFTPFEGLRVAGPLPAVEGGSAAKTLALESNVRFLLRSDVRRAGSRLRVGLLLTDTADGEEIWSRTLDFESRARDVFHVEDAVVEKVVGQLAGPNSVMSRRLSVAQRPDGSSTAAAALQAHEAFVSSPSREGYADARERMTATARRDPSDPVVLAVLADVCLTGWWVDLTSHEESRKQGEEFAARAVQLAPYSQNARLSLAFAHFLARRRRLFRAEVDRALAINPHNAVVTAGLGLLVGCDGDLERGLSMATEAFDKNAAVPSWARLLGFSLCFRQSEYELALEEAEQFSMPGVYLDPLLRAASLGALGRVDDAEPEVARLLRMVPDFSIRGRRLLRRVLHDDGLVERLLAGLAAAGAPIKTRVRLAHRAAAASAGEP